MSEELESTVATAGAEATPNVCQMLRTKTAFGTFVGNLWSWQSGNSTTAVYWCLRTMETAGPDDGYAHPHTCCQGRECYEESME
ncbi:MAG TPA: hypothetical protein VGC66_07525 [Pyrinomonadaceae bacterium]|jgi:hypothetical protein